jgi:phage host-nuclease inhibitor protein Gam
MEALKTKEEAAQAVKQHAHLSARLGVLITARDQATAELKKQLADLLAKRQPLIDATSAEIQSLEAQLEQWAKANRKEEFGEEQTKEFSHGFLKFRKSPPGLVLLSRWTWDKVLAALLEFPVTSQWQEFIRRDPEINKRKLLEETRVGGRLPEVKLRDIGLRVDQEETFSVKPKPEAVAQDCDLMP